jgi:hypothetical protein
MTALMSAITAQTTTQLAQVYDCCTHFCALDIQCVQYRGTLYQPLYTHTTDATAAMQVHICQKVLWIVLSSSLASVVTAASAVIAIVSSWQ